MRARVAYLHALAGGQDVTEFQPQGKSSRRDPQASGVVGMPKREPLNVDEYAREATPPLRMPASEEPQATLYCRCPLYVAERLRALAFERSKGKRRRVTQNDLLIEAVERFPK